jgi:hypothetical protein
MTPGMQTLLSQDAGTNANEIWLSRWRGELECDRSETMSHICLELQRMSSECQQCIDILMDHVLTENFDLDCETRMQKFLQSQKGLQEATFKFLQGLGSRIPGFWVFQVNSFRNDTVCNGYYQLGEHMDIMFRLGSHTARAVTELRYLLLQSPYVEQKYLRWVSFVAAVRNLESEGKNFCEGISRRIGDDTRQRWVVTNTPLPVGGWFADDEMVLRKLSGRINGR